MIEHDPFLDDPLHRYAIEFVLARVCDTETQQQQGLCSHFDALEGSDFMRALSKEQRSAMLHQTKNRVRGYMDELIEMELRVK